MTNENLIDLRVAYARGENVTRLLRAGREINDQLSIAIAYDLQAGSYVDMLSQPELKERHTKYADAIATVLSSLEPRSILEAGVGEATMLRAIAERLALPGVAATGFDLSWSRVHVGRSYLEAGGVNANLFVGELEAVALPDSSVDVVYTSHSIESNHGREMEILVDLYRVAARWLVLFEPAYEFTTDEARTRMESLGYCRGLKDVAEKLGWKVVRHELLPLAMNPLNPTALLVIQKNVAATTAPQGFACPSCGRSLVLCDGSYFCAVEGLAYPILRGIPCLTRRNGIIASKFLE